MASIAAVTMKSETGLSCAHLRINSRLVLMGLTRISTNPASYAKLSELRKQLSQY